MIRIARWVSILAHPFVMIFLMIGIASANQRHSGEFGRNIGLISLFVILPVSALMVCKVRRRAWQNVDASHPSERPSLYLIGISGMVALVGYLLTVHPDSFLIRGTLITSTMLILCAVTTRWVKVSLHLAAAGLTATSLILFGSVAGWVVAAIIPFLAWSRFALGRHQPHELALGLLFGTLAGLAIHFV